MLGYMLDAFDVLLYVFAITQFRKPPPEGFGWDTATAGLVSSATLIASSIGGAVAGVLADRIGRRKTLIYTILMYSLASAGSATSTGLVTLLFWRSLVGLGLGGEWSAGAVLVSETWPAQHRAKAIGLMQSGWALGYMLAAVVSGLMLPHWRLCFLVGLAPAAFTLWIQRKVEEPRIWLTRKREPVSLMILLRPPLRRITLWATALATSVLFAYWGVFTWLPTFLASPANEGGGGLDIMHTSAFIFIMQTGTFLGYVSFGWLADRFGRRPVFFAYVMAAAILTPIYGTIPLWAGESAKTWLLAVGPFVGFCGTGFFAAFGSMLAELYPTSVRGAGQGMVYNIGRGASALAPYVVGAIAHSKGIGGALALNSGFFLIGAILIFTLPETKNTELH
jgi:MFS family permease